MNIVDENYVSPILMILSFSDKLKDQVFLIAKLSI